MKHVTQFMAKVIDVGRSISLTKCKAIFFTIKQPWELKISVTIVNIILNPKPYRHPNRNRVMIQNHPTF